MAESHIRIDEGIKRGPRNKRRSVPRRRDEATGLVQGIPPDLDPLEVLERYLTEQTTSQIAQSYNLSRKTLVGWLREQAPDRWKQVQIARALCRKDDGDDGIEGACDALSLARAREMLKSGQWDLERLDSSNYGPKQEVTLQVDHRITVKDALGDSLLELFKSVRGVETAALAQPNSVIDLQPDTVQQLSVLAKPVDNT